MKKSHYIDMYLQTETASHFMTPNPLSIRQDATIEEGVEFLRARGITAAPVIDKGGRPVGVVSREDILVHDHQPAVSGKNETMLIRDIMTPAVFSVTPDTPAKRVINDMSKLNVHRLFVVDESGVLIGVISALDVLRYLSNQCSLAAV